jgi:hypothetical protein
MEHTRGEFASRMALRGKRSDVVMRDVQINLEREEFAKRMAQG